MQWNYNIPGGHYSLNMSRRELERCSLTYFLNCLPKEKPDMFMAEWDPVLEDGVRFWFDGMNQLDGQGLPAAALSWMKILNRLARELKYVPSRLALSRFCGKVKWEIAAPWRASGYSRGIDHAVAAMGRRMLPFMKSEAARKIESDLSGNMFVSDAAWRDAFYADSALQTGCSTV